MVLIHPKIYTFTNLRSFLAACVAMQPEGSRDETARWLARHLGCSREWVWNLVSGERKLPPEKVTALARALGLDEAEREYLRRLVEFENATVENLREARLALWRLHAEQTKLPTSEIDAMLAREEVPGAAEGALLPVLAVLDQQAKLLDPRAIAPLLLVPPDPTRLATALSQLAEAPPSGELLSPRLLALDPPGFPDESETLMWHGLFDLAREGLVRTTPSERDFYAVTWSVDGRASAEVARATEKLGRGLRALVRRTAEQPVDRLHLVLVEQQRLSEVLWRDGGKKRPPAGTEPPGLPLPTPPSRVQEGSPQTRERGERPCLYLYLDFSRYARDWIAWRRLEGSPCSASWLARRMGTGKTLANDLCTGAALLRPGHVPGVAHAFGLTDEEAIYLEGLARLNLATHPEDRARERHALLAWAAERGVRTTEGEDFRASSHWAPRAVHALSFLRAFQDNPAWISIALRGRIPWRDVPELLTVMQGAGLLEPGPGGALRPAAYHVRNPYSHAGLARFAYHDSLLRLCQSELRSPTRDQLFRGYVLALPDAARPALREHLAAFKAAQLAAYQAADTRGVTGSEGPDRVVVGSLQHLPLTLPFHPTALTPRGEPP